MKIFSAEFLVFLYLSGVGVTCTAGENPSINTWIKPVKDGWKVISMLNVGDRVGVTRYRMVGVPDGLGAMDNGDATLSVFMNHELASDMGKLRTHAGRGAFVSRWTLDINTLKVVDGADLISMIG